MTIIDYVIFGVYMAGVMAMGIYHYLRNVDSEDYYVGGRNMGAGHIGLSIVATDVGGNAEVVNAPELGCIVPFGDGEALRAALEAALARDWDRRAIIDYARANRWETRVEALLGIYARVLGKA